jgi:hypothetical protein
MDKFFIYRINEYGEKQYFLGDKKFSCWLPSKVGATSFSFFDALRMEEHIVKTEKISVTDLHIE